MIDRADLLTAVIGIVASVVGSSTAMWVAMSKKADKADVARLENKFDARFEGVDAKFERLEAKFDARFEGVDARFERLEAKFDSRFERLDTKLDALVMRLVPEQP
ncbi:MAG: hypothetical protein ACRDY7_03610 [Acidimicrobiia bacterium]